MDHPHRTAAKRHSQARAHQTGQHVAVPDKPPAKPRSFGDGTLAPLVLLFGIVCVSTTWGWRLVIGPLIFLAWRALHVLVLGGLAVACVALSVDRAFGPLSPEALAATILVTFFVTTGLVLWNGRGLRPHHVPAIRKLVR